MTNQTLNLKHVHGGKKMKEFLPMPPVEMTPTDETDPDYVAKRKGTSPKTVGFIKDIVNLIGGFLKV